MPEEEKIGFPAPLLGEQSQRLNILARGEQWFALEKPLGASIDADPWYPHLPMLVPALEVQLKQGKPELERLGLPDALAVYNLEPELAGIALLAARGEALDRLRNAYGSNEIELTFEFLSEMAPGEEPERFCELPVARHKQKPRAHISHETGRQASTHFHYQESVQGVHIWEARAQLHRPHQFRIHAFEVGLPICGDSLYGQSPALLLSRFKRRYSLSKGRVEKPLCENVHAWLKSVRCESLGLQIERERPKPLASLLKQLRKLG